MKLYVSFDYSGEGSLAKWETFTFSLRKKWHFLKCWKKVPQETVCSITTDVNIHGRCGVEAHSVISMDNTHESESSVWIWVGFFEVPVALSWYVHDVERS